MDDKDIEKFDPTVAELTRMVEVTKGITATDLTDKAQLDIVHKNRIALKTARVKIEKKGKELREDAILFQKKVIAKEKELIGIIEPEEDRLAAIEKEADELAVKQERMEKLPARILRLRDIGDGVEVADDFLLSLDSTAFEGYFNDRVAKKNEADRLKAEADQRVKDEENRKALAEKEKALFEAQEKADADRRANEAEASRLQAEKDAREREDKAREEERAKAAEDARRAEEERVAREKREAEEAAKKEAERIAAEKEEAAKLAKREEYKKFRAEHGWTEETKGDFKEEKTEREVVLWKKVGTFEI